MSDLETRQRPRTPAAAANSRELEELRDLVAAQESRLEALAVKLADLEAHKSERRWSVDDSAFLIYVLGFSAGAHMERPGPTAEQIFARSRDLMVKVLGAGGGHGSNGGNGS